MYVKSIVCNFRKLAKLDKLSFDWKTLKTISITNKENCRNKKSIVKPRKEIQNKKNEESFDNLGNISLPELL